MKAARIEFPECNGGYQLTQGTRVITEDGEIRGITRIDIHLGVDDVVTAEIELHPVIKEVNGVEAHFVMRHPLTDKFEEVSKIVFGDGSEVDFGEIESAMEAFVRAAKIPPPPSPPPPRSIKGDAPHARSFRRIIRDIFDISERKRWTKAVSRAWFALKA